MNEFPEETSPIEPPPNRQTGVDYYASEIARRTLKTVDDVFNLAEIYLTATKELNVGQLRALMRHLLLTKDKDKSFGKGIASKYRKIAQDTRLRAEPLRGLLPPNYTIIYEISLLSVGQIENGIRDKIIRPGVRKSEIEALRTKKFKRSKRLALSSIVQHGELTPTREAALQKSLRELVARYPEIGMASGNAAWRYRSI